MVSVMAPVSSGADMCRTPIDLGIILMSQSTNERESPIVLASILFVLVSGGIRHDASLSAVSQ
jgi:hypothetical protein